jgi:hypothetical protein
LRNYRMHEGSLNALDYGPSAVGGTTQPIKLLVWVSMGCWACSRWPSFSSRHRTATTAKIPPALERTASPAPCRHGCPFAVTCVAGRHAAIHCSRALHSTPWYMLYCSLLAGATPGHSAPVVLLQNSAKLWDEYDRSRTRQNCGNG